MAVIKVSITGIKNIFVNNLSIVCTNMQKGIFDHPLIFTGTTPSTKAQVTTIITNFTSAHSEFALGGLGQKKEYEDSKTAIVGCMLDFAPYVDGIAKGDLTTLEMTCLPLTGKGNQTKAKILAGDVPMNVEGIPGTTGKIAVSCDFLVKIHFILPF